MSQDHDIEIAFENFCKLQSVHEKGLSEADTRSKIIDTLFKECLGWDETDIRRETHVTAGYLDYIFSLKEVRIFVLEAKKEGAVFIVPEAYKRRKYKTNGVIWNQKDIRAALLQAQRYAIDVGVNFAVISNGHQLIIFEAFRSGGSWKDGSCWLYRSLDDIKENFTEFWNVLSREAVSKGSLHTYISGRRPILHFDKPLDFFHYEDQKVTQNYLARFLQPFMESIFGEMIDDYQQEILEKCYVFQKQDINARESMLPRFDPLPHYADKYGIEIFFESETHAGKFQISFEKCEKFLRQEIPEGSLMLLLGGIGSGKTTFIHHFFKVTLKNRSDILWFYVDFRQSSPNPEKIEEYLLQSIIEDYERRYESRFKEELNSMGFGSPSKSLKDILPLFSILIFRGFSIALVLDNVDQHSLTSPEYQERVFLVAQNLTKTLKTITILTLREESFFRSTRSGVINAYNMASDIFHISSPRFEHVLRHRVDYMLNILESKDEEISLIIRRRINLGPNKSVVRLLFKIIRQSIRSSRPTGKQILQFMDDITGGNIRQSLNFFNKFVTSGNTDIQEMLSIEVRDNPEGYPLRGYIIPFHHIIRSIVLQDSRYYSMNQSFVMNVFDINPEYTNSHFTHLRILRHLNKKLNNYSTIGKGYADIGDLLGEGEGPSTSQMAIADSMVKLANFGLVEFDNQSRTGFETASHLRITRNGLYYLNRLIRKFVYLDLIWGDTPIGNPEVVQSLRSKVSVDEIEDELEKMTERFRRTEMFLEYLRQAEEREWAQYPEMRFSNLTQEKFMDSIIKEYHEEKKYILERMQERRAMYGVSKTNQNS